MIFRCPAEEVETRTCTKGLKMGKEDILIDGTFDLALKKNLIGIALYALLFRG